MPFIQFAGEKLHLVRALGEVVGSPSGKRKHLVHLVLFAFVVGALAGMARIAHLEWLRDDAVMLKFVRLAHWPVRKVFAAALGGLSDKAAERLGRLVMALGLAPLQGARTVVHADYRDGTAIKETETISFLTETVARVRAALGPVELPLRADSASGRSPWETGC